MLATVGFWVEVVDRSGVSCQRYKTVDAFLIVVLKEKLLTAWHTFQRPIVHPGLSCVSTLAIVAEATQKFTNIFPSMQISNVCPAIMVNTKRLPNAGTFCVLQR